MAYCSKYQVVCDNALPDGSCRVNTCTRHKVGQVRIATSSGYAYGHLGRQCEICGKTTNNIEQHICNECAEDLRKLLNKSFTPSNDILASKPEPQKETCKTCTYNNSIIYMGNKYKCAIDERYHASFDTCGRYEKGEVNDQTK